MSTNCVTGKVSKNECSSHWKNVYKKCQPLEKCLQIVTLEKCLKRVFQPLEKCLQKNVSHWKSVYKRMTATGKVSTKCDAGKVSNNECSSHWKNVYKKIGSHWKSVYKRMAATGKVSTNCTTVKVSNNECSRHWKMSEPVLRKVVTLSTIKKMEKYDFILKQGLKMSLRLGKMAIFQNLHPSVNSDLRPPIA